MVQDSELLRQGMGVQPLVGKLRDYLPRGTVMKKRKKEKGNHASIETLKESNLKKYAA